jgi:hypothetical protein
VIIQRHIPSQDKHNQQVPVAQWLETPTFLAHIVISSPLEMNRLYMATHVICTTGVCLNLYGDGGGGYGR